MKRTKENLELERRVLELVDLALEQKQDDRLDFVNANTQDDEPLRARALAVLNSQNDSVSDIATGGALQVDQRLSMPARIGSYQIECELGQGGMGTVYLGRRAEEDFELSVAIKVVRNDSLSPRLIERLQRERKTLARLRHPNIAQMFDGGKSEDGFPYYVMEYIDGIRLDEFVSSHNTGLKERLQLFLDACSAVVFAHQNLVIHRDLSPANLLVTNDGNLKLIDFGISHNLGDTDPDESPDLPRLTKTAGYDAPERLKGIPASTVTDVYALGVILKELVESESGPRIDDLAAIAAKASHPSPDMRYPSVDGLVMDVKAYLDNKPVTAADNTLAYLLSRFVGRNRTFVTVAAMLVLVTFTVGIVMSVLYVRADNAEQLADQRFDDVRDITRFLLFDVHDEVAKIPGSTQVRETLTQTGLSYLEKLAETAGSSGTLRLEIADGYKRLSDVSGNPRNPNLGDRELSATLLRKAVEEIDKAMEIAPTDLETQRAYVDIGLANAVHEGFSENNFERGYDLLLNVRSTLSVLSLQDNLSKKDRVADAYTDTAIGYFLLKLNNFDSSMEEIGKGLTKYERLAGEFPDDTEILMGIGRANVMLGEAMAWQVYFLKGDEVTGEDYQKTLPFFNKGVDKLFLAADRADATLETDMQLIIGLLKRANTTCYMDGHRKDGLADLRQGTQLAESLITADAHDDRIYEQLSHLTLQQADCYHQMGELEKAITPYEAVITRRREQLAKNPANSGLLVNLGNSLHALSGFQLSLNDWAGACATARELSDMWEFYDKNQGMISVKVDEERKNNDEFLAKCEIRGL